MQIGVIGINHKLATLTLRENLVKGTLLRLKERCSHHVHYIYLTTCNRVEIYFSTKDLVATHSQLLQLLCDHVEEEIAHKFYSYFREDCFLHLAKVTAGLDSAILFETEIQGQVKRAYEEAAIENMLCPEMHFLFQKSLSIGKKIRSLFPKGRGMESLEEAIARIGHSFFGSLINKRLLFVGLSEINRKIAHYFESLGVRDIAFCNRSLDKKVFLKGGKTLFGLEHLQQWHTYDMTVFGTTCPDYLLEEGACLERQHLMIDLSVPRNVHPRLSKVSKLTLLNVEQIDKLIERRCKSQGVKISRIECEQVSQAVHRCLEKFICKTIILN